MFNNNVQPDKYSISGRVNAVGTKKVLVSADLSQRCAPFEMCPMATHGAFGPVGQLDGTEVHFWWVKPSAHAALSVILGAGLAGAS